MEGEITGASITVMEVKAEPRKRAKLAGAANGHKLLTLSLFSLLQNFLPLTVFSFLSHPPNQHFLLPWHQLQLIHPHRFERLHSSHRTNFVKFF